MTLLARVVSLLDTQHVPHALIGAAALATVGVARSTYDIDLLTTDDRVLAAGFWDPLAAEGIGVECRRGDHEDPLAGVARIEQPGERPIDVIVGRHSWQTRAVERARRLPAGPPVVQAGDLVLLKLYAGGAQDLWDVRELLALPEAAALAADVERDLVSLPAGMQRLWASLR